jgi:hypothetical protein
MTTITLSRAQRRQMQKLGGRVDRVTNADRLFFERRPERQHRVRLASQAEIGQNEILSGEPMYMPPGCRAFCIVKNIMPGVRLRLFGRGLEGSETDLSETMARAIYEATSTPRSREIEAALRRKAAEGWA